MQMQHVLLLGAGALLMQMLHVLLIMGDVASKAIAV